MYTSWIIAAGLLSLVQAQSYHAPTNATFGSLYTPDTTHPVTTGQTFQVTWDPTGHTTDGSTISLVLCHGPSNNCVNAPNAIVSGIPASQASYNWAVPCSLAPGIQSTATGYGMLIIVDQTGQFQYSTQFSVVAGSSCGSAPVNSTTTSTTSSSTKSSSGSQTTSSGGWNSWSSSVHTITTSAPAYTTAVSPTPVVLTTPAATSLVPSSSPSTFHGAANKIGGSAAGLVVAVGAAFFAL